MLTITFLEEGALLSFRVKRLGTSNSSGVDQNWYWNTIAICPRVLYSATKYNLIRNLYLHQPKRVPWNQSNIEFIHICDHVRIQLIFLRIWKLFGPCFACSIGYTIVTGYDGQEDSLNGMPFDSKLTTENFVAHFVSQFHTEKKM